VSERESLGTPINGFDAQMAAICSVNQATLVTRNIKDFHDTGINLINPWVSISPPEKSQTWLRVIRGVLLGVCATNYPRGQVGLKYYLLTLGGRKNSIKILRAGRGGFGVTSRTRTGAWPCTSRLSYRLREPRKPLSLTQIDIVSRYLEARGANLRIEIEYGAERNQIA
jgi:hypothetical protein